MIAWVVLATFVATSTTVSTSSTSTTTVVEMPLNPPPGPRRVDPPTPPRAPEEPSVATERRFDVALSTRRASWPLVAPEGTVALSSFGRLAFGHLVSASVLGGIDATYAVADYLELELEFAAGQGSRDRASLVDETVRAGGGIASLSLAPLDAGFMDLVVGVGTSLGVIDVAAYAGAAIEMVGKVDFGATAEGAVRLHVFDVAALEVRPNVTAFDGAVLYEVPVFVTLNLTDHLHVAPEVAWTNLLRSAGFAVGWTSRTSLGALLLVDVSGNVYRLHDSERWGALASLSFAMRFDVTPTSGSRQN